MSAGLLAASSSPDLVPANSDARNDLTRSQSIIQPGQFRDVGLVSRTLFIPEADGPYTLITPFLFQRCHLKSEMQLFGGGPIIGQSHSISHKSHDDLIGRRDARDQISIYLTETGSVIDVGVPIIVPDLGKPARGHYKEGNQHHEATPYVLVAGRDAKP